MDQNNNFSPPGFTWFVFSKDRALQLDALLRSLKESVGCVAPCEVLYKATSDGHLKAYNEVFARHLDLVPRPRCESQFNRDVIDMVSAMGGDHLAFLVDDQVFVSPVNLSQVLAVDPRVATYSFRLGLRIVRCQPVGDLACGLPPFIKPEGLPSEWLAWAWSTGKGDWSARNALDGNVLSRNLVLATLESDSNFQGPQTLEKVLFASSFCTKFGVCNKHPQAINLAINRVSSENVIFPHGTLSADNLLQAWESGLQANLSIVRTMTPNACHVICDLPFEPRPRKS